MRLSIPFALILAGWMGFLWLGKEPDKTQNPPSKPQAVRTQVVELKVVDYPVIIKTHGLVQAHHEVTLNPQVSGRIVEVSPNFEAGSFVTAGETLLRLDDTDFQTAVIIAQAQVARAKAAHAQEEARAKQARLNWEDLGYTGEPNELVLRLPQLREAEANVESAEAQLARSQRDLDRTHIVAPFDGRVLRRQVGLGQSIGASTPLGALFAVDYVEVRLPLATQELPFLTLPETPDDPPLSVELRDALRPASDTLWKARIVRTEGALDSSTLELFAIARIDDPFGRASGQPPLRIGQPVVAYITGHTLTNVVALPRVAVRELDQIHLVQPPALTLKSHTIQSLWSDEDHIVVRDPLIPHGSLLATTHLVYAPDGVAVEIIPQISTNLDPVLSATPLKALSQ